MQHHQFRIDGNVTCHLMNNGEQWIACCLLQTPRGNILLACRADENVIREFAQDYLTAQGISSSDVAETGRFGRRLKKLGKKIARGRVVRGIRKGVRTLKRIPGFSQFARMGISAVPGGGTALEGIRTAKRAVRGIKGARKAIRGGSVRRNLPRYATDLADKVARGDRNAMRAVSRLRFAASSGNHTSADVMRALKQIYTKRYGVGPTEIVNTGALFPCRGYARSSMGPCEPRQALAHAGS
jgi:hypothetical protein